MHSKALAVTQHMLDQLLLVYGEPQTGDLNEFLIEYTHQLMNFDPEELSEGRKILLAFHKYRRWPLPAECREACFKARERIQRRRAAAKQPKQATDKRVIHFLSKEQDPLQWKAWMAQIERSGDRSLLDRCQSVGAIAVNVMYPGEYEGLDRFVSCGPFVFDREAKAHITGWTTVHDAAGERIR